MRNAELGPDEAAFIHAQRSFYMATVSETGWPYVQHRGGAAGFLRVVDAKTLTFTDLPGNRQFISVGNVANDDRVALILMDYTHRQRLKLLGRLSVQESPGEARTERTRRRSMWTPSTELPEVHPGALRSRRRAARPGRARCAHRRTGSATGRVAPFVVGRAQARRLMGTDRV